MGNSFKDFLSIQVSSKTGKRLSKSSINSYDSGIKSMAKLYKDELSLDKDILKMNYQEFLGILKLIEETDLYDQRNKTQNHFDSATLHQYRSYLKSIDSNPNIDFSDISDDSSEVIEKEEEFIGDKIFRVPEYFSNHKNYFTALLAKPFVILAGNSGTGKSKISIDFANWLGKKDSENEIYNKLVVPIGADWTDNTKILGFYNPIEKIYESSKILDFVLLAEENSTIPFFLILDEMNLSHVERYFSDFLSAMESKERIILYSKTEGVKSNIPETVPIPENLFVIGTVNIDETTYMFSPKVLDRANVIEFNPNQKDVLSNFEEDKAPIEITPANDGSAEGFLSLAKQIREAKKLPIGAEKSIDILQGISDILVDSIFEFAYRTTKEIRLYLNAAAKLAENEGKILEENDFISLMDEQLLQKIFPKIHGNRSQIGNLLNNLSNFCDGKTVKIDEKSISGFNLPLSKKKIDRMIKQLETSQFASFI